MSIRNILVFAVIAVGLALLIRYTVYLYREELRDWRTVQVEFADVGGLREKDAVLIKGSRLGRVAKEGIKLFEDRQLVTLQVLPEVVVFADAKAEIVSANSLGFVNVVLDLGTPAAGPLAEGAHIQGTVAVGVGQAPAGPDRGGELRRNLSDFAAMTSAIQDPRSGSTGELLFDPHRKIALRSALHDLKQQWRDADRQLAEVEAGAGLGRGLDGDALHALSNTIARLRASFERVGEGVRGAARGEGNIGRFVADPVQGRATREALDGWSDALDGVREGRGLAGRLSDPGSSTTEALEQAVDALASGTTEVREGRGLLGALASPEVDEPARDLMRSLPRALAELERSPAVRDRDAYFQVHDGAGSLHDSVVRLRRGVEGLRRNLEARSTFQGAVFAIF